MEQLIDQFIDQFIDRYLPRKEILHRLPVSMPISRFWPALEKARRKRATLLPLHDQANDPFWFVLNTTIEKQCDAIAELARRDIVFSSPALICSVRMRSSMRLSIPA